MNIIKIIIDKLYKKPSLVKPIIRQRFLLIDLIITKLHDYLVNYFKKTLYEQLKSLSYYERKRFLNEINVDNYFALGFAKFEIISKIHEERKSSENIG